MVAVHCFPRKRCWFLARNSYVKKHRFCFVCICSHPKGLRSSWLPSSRRAGVSIHVLVHAFPMDLKPTAIVCRVWLRIIKQCSTIPNRCHFRSRHRFVLEPSNRQMGNLLCHRHALLGAYCSARLYHHLIAIHLGCLKAGVMTKCINGGPHGLTMTT